MDLKPTRTSSDCGVSLWGFGFNWSGVLWFQLVESFISDFLGGVLFFRPLFTVGSFTIPF